jgi:hypothetical protein
MCPSSKMSVRLRYMLWGWKKYWISVPRAFACILRTVRDHERLEGPLENLQVHFGVALQFRPHLVMTDLEVRWIPRRMAGRGVVSRPTDRPLNKSIILLCKDVAKFTDR